MRITATTTRRLALLLIVASTVTAARAARADGDRRPFDFSDAFYRSNGINPDAILARVNGMDGASVPDRAPDANHRGVRVIATNGGFDDSGHPTYFNILGAIMPAGFTADAAGQRARTIADRYRVLVFPRAGTDPLGIVDRRQDNLLDTRDGYFSNDPLGLWTLTFVSYTASAFGTSDGRRALADLAARNGLDLDGTPLITTASDVDNLASEGFVILRTRPRDGSLGFPWVLCPPLKDPRGGAIAPDAFLLIIRRPDGTPVVPTLAEEFHCLQQTGDFCR